MQVQAGVTCTAHFCRFLPSVLFLWERRERTHSGIRIDSALISPDPGKAVARVDGTEISLGNGALGFELTTENNKFRFAKFTDVLAGKFVPVPFEVFVLRFKDGREIPATRMEIVSRPAWKTSKEFECFEARDRIGGKKVAVTLQSSDPKFDVVWSGIFATVRTIYARKLQFGHRSMISSFRDSTDLLEAARREGGRNRCGFTLGRRRCVCGFEHRFQSAAF